MWMPDCVVFEAEVFERPPTDSDAAFGFLVACRASAKPAKKRKEIDKASVLARGLAEKLIAVSSIVPIFVGGLLPIQPFITL
jgi:hypothetical protein